MKKFLRVITVFVLTLVTAVSLSACTFIIRNDNGFTPSSGSPGGSSSGSAEFLSVSIKELDQTTRQEMSLVDAVAKVERSVVAIETDGGAGAGVIIDVDVQDASDDNFIYIVTCHHVISSTGAITVYIPDETGDYLNNDYIFQGTIGGSVSGNSDKAVTLVGGDMSSDIAVIKIDMSKPAYSGKTLSIEKITKAVIPSTDYTLRKGETVFAIGNPTGSLPGWVCTGVVASLEETIPVSDIGNMKLMGISATTNPGNSGGGLFNMYGELVGITNAGNTSYSAINFAIPLYTSDAESDSIDNGVVNMVKQLVGSATATNYGFVDGRKTALGITIAKGTTTTSQEVTYIYEVVEGGLADSVGIKQNDIIVSITVNGATNPTAKTFEDFSAILSALKIGDVVTIKVQRTNNFNQTKQYDFTMYVVQYRFCDTGA